MLTSPDNLVSPDSVDPYNLVVDLAAMQDSVQDALTDIRGDVVASSNRLTGLYASIPAAGSEGRVYYATDTDREWFDTGSNWISHDSGLYLIRPTSVAGGGALQSDGSVTYAGATSVSLNGIFSTRFQSYKIVSTYATSPAAVPNLRLRAAGTDATGSNYAFARNWVATSSTNQGSSSTSTAVSVGGVAGTSYFIPLDIFDPAATAITHFSGTTHSNGGTTPSSCTLSATYTATTAFDGFTFYHASQNISGTIRVYGLA